MNSNIFLLIYFEITKLSGINKISVFKLLYTLEYRGFVEKGTHSKYRLGKRLFSSAQAATSRQNLLDVANPFITNLWANTQQSVTLCTLNPSGRLVFLTAKLEKNQTTVTARTGADFEVHTNSAGKVLLANSHPDIQEIILDSISYTKKTEHTITDKKTLKEQLNHYRGQSIVLCIEESLHGYGDISSPIFDSSGNCIACVNLVFNLNQSEEKKNFFMQQLYNATRQISLKMGYQSSFSNLNSL